MSKSEKQIAAEAAELGLMSALRNEGQSTLEAPREPSDLTAESPSTTTEKIGDNAIPNSLYRHTRPLCQWTEKEMLQEEKCFSQWFTEQDAPLPILSEPQWELWADFFGSRGVRYQFKMLEWLMWGEENMRAKYTKIEERLGINRAYLREMVRVARAVWKVRSEVNGAKHLPFGFFTCIASLEEDVQRHLLEKLCTLGIRERWSVRRFEWIVKEYRERNGLVARTVEEISSLVPSPNADDDDQAPLVIPVTTSVVTEPERPLNPRTITDPIKLGAQIATDPVAKIGEVIVLPRETTAEAWVFDTEGEAGDDEFARELMLTEWGGRVLGAICHHYAMQPNQTYITRPGMVEFLMEQYIKQHKIRIPPRIKGEPDADDGRTGLL